MMIIKVCSEEDIAVVGEFYDDVVKHLYENINYPKWVYKVYPSEESVREMIEAECQFMCMDKQKVVGAFVLNDDPQGKYENAVWSRQLSEGEYMVCHTLATKPLIRGKGMEHKGTIQLETERLILRPFVESDTEMVFRNWTNDDKVTEFLRWPTHKDISVTERILKKWVKGYKKKSVKNTPAFSRGK